VSRVLLTPGLTDPAPLLCLPGSHLQLGTAGTQRTCPLPTAGLRTAACSLPTAALRSEGSWEEPGSHQAAAEQEAGEDAVHAAYLSQDITAPSHPAVTPAAPTNVQQDGADPRFP